MIILQNCLTLHLKCYHRNFFFILSNQVGKIIYQTNSGCLGFKNMQKRSLDAYNCIIETVLKKILQYNIKFVILKIEGLNNIYLSLFTKQILLLSNKSSLAIVGLKYIKKISHNGCRLKY